MQKKKEKCEEIMRERERKKKKDREKARKVYWGRGGNKFRYVDNESES